MRLGQRCTYCRYSLLLLLGQIIVGCTSHQIGPDRPISIESDVALVQPIAYPDLNDFTTRSSDVQASVRNQMLTARMYIADVEYHSYEFNLTREMQDEGLGATLANLGLTTSATLAGAAYTKTVLSAMATGFTGVDKAYNQKELLSNEIQQIQTQMRTDRKTQAAVIYAKMLKDSGNSKVLTPISEYTLPMALSDADMYYQTGTLASALIGLTKTVSNAGDKC